MSEISEVAVALESLRWSYTSDRQMRDAMHEPETSPRLCRYCGKARQLYANSRLDGHAACVVSESFKRQLATAMKDPRLNYELLARALGVSSMTIRSWFRAAKAQ